MRHLLKIKCVDLRVNMNILGITSVKFTLTTLQVLNFKFNTNSLETDNSPLLIHIFEQLTCAVNMHLPKQLMTSSCINLWTANNLHLNLPQWLPMATTSTEKQIVNVYSCSSEHVITCSCTKLNNVYLLLHLPEQLTTCFCTYLNSWLLASVPTWTADYLLLHLPEQLITCSCTKLNNVYLLLHLLEQLTTCFCIYLNSWLLVPPPTWTADNLLQHLPEQLTECPFSSYSWSWGWFLRRVLWLLWWWGRCGWSGGGSCCCSLWFSADHASCPGHPSLPSTTWQSQI